VIHTTDVLTVGLVKLYKESVCIAKYYLLENTDMNLTVKKKNEFFKIRFNIKDFLSHT
jgi:hypothetical protein